MTDSIISNEQECFRCGTTLNLHRHHIFFGRGRRDISEKYGCWVWLCANHHNMSSSGIHFDHDFDTAMKKRCQMLWEKKYGNRDDFIRTFGRSYL